MQIAEFLRASFVGALLFSPAMADEVQKVHDDALRVLHEQLAQPAAAQIDPLIAKERAEQRNADRESLQAERRQQFEQFVKERQQLRRQQHDYEADVARRAGQIRPDDYNPAHSPALVALHRNAEATMQLAQADADDIHAKALEALHEQMQNQSVPASAPAVTTQSTTTNPSTASPQPSPDLQRRLKQMQLELEQEEAQKAKARGDAKPASVTIVPAPTSATPTADAYTQELEQRARNLIDQAPAATPMPNAAPVVSRPGASPAQGLDPATREMIRRQDQEISDKLSSPAANAAPTRSPVPASTPLPQTLTPEQQAAAVAALRQQEQRPGAPAETAAPKSNSTPATSPKPTAASKAPVVTQRTETDAADVQYSKELEERARQILLERAQSQQAGTTIQAAPVATPAPVAAPVENITPALVQPAAPALAATPAVAPAPSATPAPAPNVFSTPTTTEVHSQPQQALEQVNTGTAPRTKMDRLKEITDLYRADKMTPAEYHQKRAQILAEPQ